jgi:hypothetical protein
MSSWFKKSLILIFCIEAIFFIAPRFLNFDPAAIIVSLLGNLTNKERQAENLPELKVSPLLMQSAELKAEDMANFSYFAHTSPEGKTPWYFLDQVGYKYQYAGENLAINFTNTEDVTAAWLNSPTHKANIVKSQYTEMGSAIATGTYLGRSAVFIVQVYANPRIEEVDTVSQKTSGQKLAVASGNTGEVLGTSTVASLNQEKLTSDIITPKDDSLNRVLIIILAGLVILLLLNIFIKLGNNHQKLTEILLLTIVVIMLFFVNINFVRGKNEIYQSAIDYSKEQTVK